LHLNVADHPGIFHPRLGHGVGGQLVALVALLSAVFGGQADFVVTLALSGMVLNASGAGGLSAQRRQQNLRWLLWTRRTS